jgi:glutaredoxin
VGGEWCKWCVKLKETLTKDNRLIQAIAEDSLQLAWVTVNKKTVDQSGIRERFNVKSVPYLLLLNPEGATIEATEFIGDEDVNINEYLRWLRSHNDDAL